MVYRLTDENYERNEAGPNDSGSTSALFPLVQHDRSNAGKTCRRWRERNRAGPGLQFQSYSQQNLMFATALGYMLF